jgi:hypothetical protein
MPLAWVAGVFTASVGAAITADVMARNRLLPFGLSFVTLVVVTWLPCLLAAVLRLQRLVRSGYSRQDLITWLARPESWPSSPMAVPVSWNRRSGIAVLWPAVPILAQTAWLLQQPSVNGTAVIAQDGLTLLLITLAAGAGLTCPVIEKSGRQAQLRYWREGLFGPLLFSLVQPLTHRRRPAPTSAV